MTQPKNPPLTSEIRGLLAPHFDEKFYLAANPDVALSGTDPLTHYHHTGWREGRDPSRVFNTAYYLARYQDIAAAGLNPLLHFILAGQQEGRDPVRLLDAWRERLEATRSPRVAAQDWKGAERETNTLEQERLFLELSRGLVSRDLLISISHDNYAENFGGVQNLIADEESASVAAGWCYLHVWPMNPLPLLADYRPGEDFYVGIRLGRDFLGYVEVNDLLQVLGRFASMGVRSKVVIHHFMGHAPEHVLEIVRATKASQSIVWAHDFFSSCTNYTLLRNDVVFCNSPDLEAPACTICSYGSERVTHVQRIRNFFEAVTPVVLSPSQDALGRWTAYNKLPYSEGSVVPLGRLALAHSDLKWAPGKADHPLRVAHIGGRSFHKGWPVFEALALRLSGDPRYSFFQLGVPNGPSLPGCIEHVPVQVTRDNRTAMIEAIAEARIDVVINWPLWPETFSFVAHEALAGGGFVITHPAAGNVWPVIAHWAPNQGISLESREALFACFESGEIIKRLARTRRSRGAFILQSGTIDWLNRSGGSSQGSRAPAEAQLSQEVPVGG